MCVSGKGTAQGQSNVVQFMHDECVSCVDVSLQGIHWMRDVVLCSVCASEACAGCMCACEIHEECMCSVHMMNVCTCSLCLCK